MRERPAATTAGLHHLALYVSDLERCLDFYTRLLGMEVEWQPDSDNVFLSSGSDNLALHRTDAARAERGQRLDHLGFIINTMDEVDRWHAFLADAGVEIVNAPKTHRDGARSFYCRDPDHNVVQMIFHPPLSTGVERG